MEFIEIAYQKKRVTRKDIPLASISYYFWVRVLKENNIIKMEGIDEKNQHIYALTEKGNKLAQHSIEIRKLLGDN
jgi:predicted transcriptional regulator